MVNTEPAATDVACLRHYNILNIVVNTEPILICHNGIFNYNILNIVVNTEHDIP